MGGGVCAVGGATGEKMCVGNEWSDGGKGAARPGKGAPEEGNGGVEPARAEQQITATGAG